MEKNFDAWNNQKKKLNVKDSRVFYQEGEVWWCALGVNIGSEQDGTGKNFDRPVIIIRGFSESVFLGAVLIGREKGGEYYFPLGIIGDRGSSVVLSQVRTIDTRRLRSRIMKLDQDVFDKLKSALQKALFG